MITSLRLKNFKSFADAELTLGPFTVLVGANASGKSNIRDAFRFLHGIGRGYSLADILGEKRGDGGQLEWTGIRGGAREATLQGETSFSLSASFDVSSDQQEATSHGHYSIKAKAGAGARSPRILVERLESSDYDGEVFSAQPGDGAEGTSGPPAIVATLQPPPRLGSVWPPLTLDARRPATVQLVEHFNVFDAAKEQIRRALHEFADMRFFDLSPDAMRVPSLPGQTVLGDRGENLSSVLLELHGQRRLRAALIDWLGALTPMDVVKLDFPRDAAGRALVNLVDTTGQRISALSASDGTLRFLSLLSMLLGPESTGVYFLEELENGIHPTRLHLLLQLIEQETARGKIQVVATTHSPQLLCLLSEQAMADAALTYRLEGRAETRIARILDIPTAADVLRRHDLGRLHGSGWLENVVAFAEDAPTPS